MKTSTAHAKVLLLVTIIAISLSVSARPIGEVQKYHIHITKETNGKKEVIDRTFTSKEELDAFVKENKIDVPEMKEPGAIIEEKEVEKTDGKKGHKVMEKKRRKITIMEKEEDNSGGKTELNITTSDLNAEERAGLIMEMMAMKGSKVEVTQIQGTSPSTTEGKIVVIEKEGTTPGKTTLSITSDELTPQERATLIQKMMSVQGNVVEIQKASTENTAKTAGVENLSALQLFPNPNSGQFRISFKTAQPTDVQLRMMDITGKEIYNETIKGSSGTYEKDINLRPAISGGSYVLEAEANGQKITTQVVVQ